MKPIGLKAVAHVCSSSLEMKGRGGNNFKFIRISLRKKYVFYKLRASTTHSHSSSKISGNIKTKKIR